MQLVVLDRIHDAHQGTAKCRDRGRTSVWWPGLSRQMEKVVKKYPTCVKQYVNTTEPVIPSELYELPWQKVAADLFELKDRHYLHVNGYFSWYVEVAKLSRTTPPDIIVHLRPRFHDTASQTSHCQTMGQSSQQSGHYTLKRTLPCEKTDSRVCTIPLLTPCQNRTQQLIEQGFPGNNSLCNSIHHNHQQHLKN